MVGCWKLLSVGPFVLAAVRAGQVTVRSQCSYKPPSKQRLWASLVAQWLRICLPMQRTRVRALVWEDPTCRRATGPVSHNC